jgi:hypothetical protein
MTDWWYFKLLACHLEAPELFTDLIRAMRKVHADNVETG